MTSKSTEYPQKIREHQYHLLDSTVWNVFQFRNDDVIIGAYAKSGTTWGQQIVAQFAGFQAMILTNAALFFGGAVYLAAVAVRRRGRGKRCFAIGGQ